MYSPGATSTGDGEDIFIVPAMVTTRTTPSRRAKAVSAVAGTLRSILGRTPRTRPKTLFHCCRQTFQVLFRIGLSTDIACAQTEQAHGGFEARRYVRGLIRGNSKLDPEQVRQFLDTFFTGLGNKSLHSPSVVD